MDYLIHLKTFHYGRYSPSYLTETPIRQHESQTKQP
uniref:Uncharacterized protein n=1 Tax=Arundo donax TaxID=35708 RepID=A0A0A9F7T7_ARUDO